MSARGILVGIGHRAQVGKDTAAREAGLEIVSFADNIRRVALEIDPYIAVAGARLATIVADLGFETAKTTFSEIRLLLMRLGRAVRDVDPDVWLRPVLADVEVWLDNGIDVAVTDMRYPNEAQAIANLGGVLVRVDRPSVPVVVDPSESALDDWPFDHIVVNDGTVDDLGAALRRIIQVGP